MFFERILLKRRLASNDAAVRIQALSALEYETDHTILLQFAGEDCDSEVRSAAIKLCREPDELSVLLDYERDPSVQALLARRIDELYGELALRAAAAEQESDAFDRIKRELIKRFGQPETDGEYTLDLLMIAKYFERIGDHAVNIAGWVLFSITGRKGENNL